MLFHQTTVDRVKTEKWPAVSRYLDEVLYNSKVSIQRSFRSVKVLAWKSFPRRVHATLTNPAWITNLLRNTFVNSDVECILRAKTLQLNLTGAIEWSEMRNIRLKFGWHLTMQLNNNRKHSMTCPPAATWMRPGATLQVQKFASKLPSSWFPSSRRD